jgi:2-methylisocitrate lyase-like PEP mutase family enzyme
MVGDIWRRSGGMEVWMNRGLRLLLDKPGLVVAPGCHDALGARIAQKLGFKAVYISGNATAASRLGKPDIGLLGLSEMVSHARRIVSAVDIPVICDADTGYGGISNVARTVQEYEEAGVAGIHIEDQVMPKKCGAMPGVEIVPLSDAVARVRAAVRAKKNRDFVIIARTDARATGDFEEALRRARVFAAAGADMIFVENLTSRSEIEEVPRVITSTPLLFDVLEKAWPWTDIPLSDIEKMGYKAVIYCLATTLTYAKATKDLLSTIKEKGCTSGLVEAMMDLHEYEEILGLSDINNRNDKVISDASEILREK